MGRAVSDAVRIISAAAAASANTSLKRKADDDEEGAKKESIGPNGLVRMKGGNPEGEPCRDFAKGKCPRQKCSWSHVKPASSVVETPP